MAEKLSEYEQARLDNIKRNEEFLKSVGLYKDPNDVSSRSTDAINTTKKRKKPKRKVNLEDLEEENLGPVRRSSRTSGVSDIKEEPVSLSDVEGQLKKKKRYAPYEDAKRYFTKKEASEELYCSDEDGNEITVERLIIQPDELRSYIESACPAHSDMLPKSAMDLCAYRCAYMSIAQLKNRIKACSTGAGKNSHLKLLAVTYMMRAMGLLKLAEFAAATLLRNANIVVELEGLTTFVRTDSGEDEDGDEDQDVKVEVEVKQEGSVKAEDGTEAVVKTENTENAETPNRRSTRSSRAAEANKPIEAPAHIKRAQERALKAKLAKQAKLDKKNETSIEIVKEEEEVKDE